MIRSSVFCLLLLVAVCSFAAQQKPTPNFYTDLSSSAASAKKTTAAAPSPARKTATPTATTSTRALAKPSQRVPSATRAQTPAPKTAAKPIENAQPAPSGKASATAKPAKYPGDIYGLAAAIQKRWNFRDMLPTAEEAARLRLDGMQKAVERCAAAFDQVSRALEHRQANIRNATAALYLLHVSRNQAPCYLSTRAEVSAAQLAVLRSTLTDDLANRAELAETYRAAREALNRSAETLASAQNSADDQELPNLTWRPSKMRTATPAQKQRRAYAISVDLSDLAKDETVSILAARVPPPDAIDAILTAERLGRAHSDRATFASFAPQPPLPGPTLNTLIDPDTPIPTDVGSSRKSKPEPPPAIEKPTSRGIVLPLPRGADVLAVAPGTVAFTGDIRGYGRTLILQHEDGLFSIYSYLATYEVAEGDRVTIGQPIGKADVIPGTLTGGVRFDVRRGKESVPAKELLGAADPAKLLARQ